MYTIIWQYTVNPVHREKFVECYNSHGTWAHLFKQSADYIGTDFLESENENQFITIDTWLSKHGYEQFLSENQTAYQEIDEHCEGFTIDEKLIGKYFTFE